MVEIEIFLSFDETQVSFLSIPRSDIERLAVFPFRWIRYVMFTISGARGVLSTTPNGPPVDYDRTGFVDAEITYYYRPLEDCAFVDHEGLNDQLTSTEQTPRRHDFRDDVIQRDRHACVVTHVEEEYCDAVHLIPRNKGDEYIAKVIQLRFPIPRDNSVPPSNVGIDDIINGTLLRKGLHVALGIGEVAFIKTPNYGLRPEDIRSYHRGDSRPDYITLHRLRKPENYDRTSESLQSLQTRGAYISPAMSFASGANVDALFQGDGGSPPSTVIHDYVYGVAAYKSWHSNRGDISTIMNEYRAKHYAQIPPFPRSPPDDTEDDTSARDRPTDSDYNPVEPRKRYKVRRRDESELAKAMDELNMVLMYVTRGITPSEAAERRQKRIE